MLSRNECLVKIKSKGKREEAAEQRGYSRNVAPVIEHSFSFPCNLPAV
jgi:hypothetical protein